MHSRFSLLAVIDRLSKRLRLPAFWAAGFAVLVLVAAIGAATDVKNTVKHGQIDLRNRVVGARAMLAHYDPYLYRWQESDPVTLLDPLLLPGSTISKTTVTPSVLAFHASFSGLGYREQKFLWLFAQWACFAAIFWWAHRMAPDEPTKRLVLASALALFGTTVWRQHVEAGQVQILYGAMAAAFIFWIREGRRTADFCAGVILGALVTFRPQFIFLGLPLLLYSRWTAAGGTVIGAGAGLAIPALLSPSVWSQYVATLRRYLLPPDNEGAPREFWNPRMPAEIEGLTNITSHAPFSDFDSSLAGVLRLLMMRWPAWVYLALIAVGAAVWLCWIWRDKKTGAPIAFVSARLLGLVLLTDLLLPIRRLPYSEALLIPIILLLAASSGRRFTQSPAALACLLAAVWFAMEIPWFAFSLLIPPVAVVLLCAGLSWDRERAPPQS